LLLAAALAGFSPCAAPQDAVSRGAYLAKAGGCVGCHTEDRRGAVPYAGGRALKTPFGTFYGPNITPDPSAGIGRWSEGDFVRALREGIAPGGVHLYPAFPYPSFTRMTEADMKDLWAYLRSVPPSAQPSRAHELRFPFGWRALIWGWKLLYFTPGPEPARAGRTAAQARGAYLVDALGHCGECHTPRNWLGAPQEDRYLAGGSTPEGKEVPNLTPARLGKWSDAELRDFLGTGLTPDGDIASQAMGEVIRNTTSQWTRKDLDAVVAYLRSVPAVADQPR